MKIILFSFYFPPDLSPGSFRLFELVKILGKKLDDKFKIIVVTTYPNRYKTFKAKINDNYFSKNIIIKRVRVPFKQKNVFLQIFSFTMYFIQGLSISITEKPDLLIGTSGRLMTLILTYISAKILKKKYIVDYRDIFSLAVKDLLIKNNYLKKISFKLFSKIENKILHNATMVNVVANSYKDIFEVRGLNTEGWHTYTNGIDDLFLKKNINLKFKNKENKKIKKILYVGNIGYAQGLKDFLPKLAEKLNNKIQLTVIGNGNEKKILLKKIKKYNINNLLILDSMPREELLKYYHEADYLFLQLKNLNVFHTSLPSKIFEYATIEKPIIAGLKGYAANFLRENIEHSIIFEPESIEDFVEKYDLIRNIKFNEPKHKVFLKKFSRKKIMNEFSEKLIENFDNNKLK